MENGIKYRISKIFFSLLTWPLIAILAPIGAVMLILLWPIVMYNEIDG